MSYDFSDLFSTATKLDADFLRNEFGYSLSTADDLIVFKNYYVTICSAVYERNAFAITNTEIEEILETGLCEKIQYFESKITSEDERKYKFLMAQAKQLKYDIDNGRSSMIRGADNKYILCEDAKNLLNEIGLIQPVRF